MLNISEINKLDVKAIDTKISEIRRELFEIRLQKATTNVEKSHQLKVLKKDIARLLTVKSSKGN